VFVTAGTEDFLVHVAVPNNNSLYEFVIDKLTARTDIADVRTSVIYEHIKTHPRHRPDEDPSQAPRPSDPAQEIRFITLMSGCP
jgi:DNA-binding Lrp family transcriptional regulator